MTTTGHFNDFATFDYWDNFDIGGKFGNKFTNEITYTNYGDGEEYLNFDNVEVYDDNKYFSDILNEFPILNGDEVSDKDLSEKMPTKPPKKDKPTKAKRPFIRKKRKKRPRGKHLKKIRRKEGGMSNRLMAGFNNMMEFLSRPGRNLRNGIDHLMRNLRR